MGTPIAGRNRAEIEGLIGFFVNTLVMRVDLGGDPTCERTAGKSEGERRWEHMRIRKCRSRSWSRRLQPERSLSHTPLFQVMIAYQSRPKWDVEMDGIEDQRGGGGSDDGKI